jgi:hypothetical protein
VCRCGWLPSEAAVPQGSAEVATESFQNKLLSGYRCCGRPFGTRLTIQEKNAVICDEFGEVVGNLEAKSRERCKSEHRTTKPPYRDAALQIRQ